MYTKVKFSYWNEKEEELIESMWTTQLENHYVLANIPFYVQEFALSDIISVWKKNGELFVNQLIKESGNSTIQIVFFDETIVQITRDILKEMGCNSELSDKAFLIAVNVPPEINYINTIKPYLDDLCGKDQLDYGEACIATCQIKYS